MFGKNKHVYIILCKNNVLLFIELYVVCFLQINK